MLAISVLSVAYGGLRALREVSLEVRDGEFVAIVGPNGAGKTTLFKTISGTVAAASGRIVYEGRDLLRLPAAERARLGIAHVPEGRQVFRTMTVMENLEMGALSPTARARWRDNLARILQLFPALAERRRQLAGTLSGGEQQMLAIARGLMAKPLILMFDEPSLGLSPLFVLNLFEIIRTLKKQGLTMLLVEQNVQMSLAVSDFAYVMSHGKIEIEGEAKQVREMPEVRKAYLGL